MNVNKVMLTGRLVADPDVHHTKDSKPVVSFRLAVNRYTKKGEESKADFFRCVAFNGLAKVCEEYLKKGKLVAIVGQLKTSQYESEGKKQSSTEIVIDNLQMMDNKPSSQEAEVVQVG